MFHLVGIGLTIDVIWAIGWGLREPQEPTVRMVSAQANVSTGCLQKTNQRVQRLSRLTRADCVLFSSLWKSGHFPF